MVDVSLTIVDINTSPSTITFTFQDGDISSVESSVAAGPEDLPLSASGPLQTNLFDFEGVVKVITLKGQITEAVTSRTNIGTTTTILEQKQFLESLCNGGQTLITFASNYESQSITRKESGSSPNQGTYASTTCMIREIRFTENSGNPSMILFNMVLVVGR